MGLTIFLKLYINIIKINCISKVAANWIVPLNLYNTSLRTQFRCIFHSISNRNFCCFSCIIAMVHQNSLTLEFWQEKIEGNLRRANTEQSVDFRRANAEPSVDFWKVNKEPSIRKPIRNRM